MIDYTYSARLVIEFCKTHRLKAKPHSGDTPEGMLFFLVESGIRITFRNAKKEKVFLSIQTHPYIAKFEFAETAIQSNKLRSIVYPQQLGYNGDLIQHHNPKDLFDHILTVKEKLKDEDFFQAVINDEDQNTRKQEISGILPKWEMMRLD